MLENKPTKIKIQTMDSTPYMEILEYSLNSVFYEKGKNVLY